MVIMVVVVAKENGEMRINHSKSDLKNVLKVDVSERTQPKADAVIIDGCAMLMLFIGHHLEQLLISFSR